MEYHYIYITYLLCIADIIQHQYDPVIVSRDSLSWYTKIIGRPAVDATCKALSLYIDWADKCNYITIDSSSDNVQKESLDKGGFLGDVMFMLKHPLHCIKGKPDPVINDSINEAVNKVINHSTISFYSQLY